MALSPNFSERRDGATPSLIVLHYTAMDDCAAATRWLCNPEAEVSAHYIIGETGELTALVDEADRAWHAGASAWGGITDVNSHSIGIELSNSGATPFANPQIEALETLLPEIMARWSIAPQGVIAHSDCAPGRKIDPGARFDWARLARQGLAVQAQPVEGTRNDASRFLQDLKTIGYTADAAPEVLLAAFRLRHRQGGDGPLRAADCALAADLAARFPVDPQGANA